MPRTDAGAEGLHHSDAFLVAIGFDLGLIDDRRCADQRTDVVVFPAVGYQVAERTVGEGVEDQRVGGIGLAEPFELAAREEEIITITAAQQRTR